MSFKELSLLKHYKTYKNDIIKEFYTPVLKQAVLYQRAVGFFSSTALIDLTKGISGMIKNGGRLLYHHFFHRKILMQSIKAMKKRK